MNYSLLDGKISNSKIVLSAMKKKTKNATSVNEPVSIYNTNRITFSTVETQNDIQLNYALSISPLERLELMRKLNDYAFKNSATEKILTPPIRLIFTSYEFIPE